MLPPLNPRDSLVFLAIITLKKSGCLQCRCSVSVILICTSRLFTSLPRGKSFDVTSFKGQTIRAYFLGTEDSSLQTSFVIDDTALNV